MEVVMNRLRASSLAAGLVSVVAATTYQLARPADADDAAIKRDARTTPLEAHALQLLDEGKRTFRSDTFGDESFWGGALRLHDAIRGAALGGVGPGVSPSAALGLGLKVDVDALPPEIVSGLQGGTVDLDDPATTLALLANDAVVGVKGIFRDC